MQTHSCEPSVAIVPASNTRKENGEISKPPWATQEDPVSKILKSKKKKKIIKLHKIVKVVKELYEHSGCPCRDTSDSEDIHPFRYYFAEQGALSAAGLGTPLLFPVLDQVQK